MSVELLALLLFASFCVLLATGLPILFCLMGVSLLFFLLFMDPRMLFISFNAMYGTITNPIMLASPLFIFMALILEFSGVTEALYRTIYKWAGPLRGSLGITTVVACAIIAAMTGLGATGVVTMGVLAYPEMRKRGYANCIAVGCIPSGGALGPIIPPSVVMIIVGGLGGISIGKLFMGGMLPGILIALFFCLYIGIRSWLQPSIAPALPPEEYATWKEKFVALRGVIVPLIIIVCVLGAIYSGACTSTEAGGVGAILTLLFAIISGKLTWPNLKLAVIRSLVINATVMWLLCGGCMLSAFVTSSGIGTLVENVLVGQTPGLTLFIMLATVLFMGCFVDAGAIVVICIPLFMPVILKQGVDPVFFGDIFSIATVIGYITPPFGMNLFYMKGVVPELSMKDIYISVYPYCALMVLALYLCILFPQIVLFLPSMMK